MVTTTPIQPHGKMSLGFESDAFGIKTWKCVCCLGFCLFQVIPLLGETKPRNSTQAGTQEAARWKESSRDKSKIVVAKAVEPVHNHKFAKWHQNDTFVDLTMKHTKHTNCHLGGKFRVFKLIQAGFVAEKCTSTTATPKDNGSRKQERNIVKFKHPYSYHQRKVIRKGSTLLVFAHDANGIGNYPT